MKTTFDRKSRKGMLVMQKRAGNCPTLTDAQKTFTEGTLTLSPSDICHFTLDVCHFTFTAIVCGTWFYPILQMRKLRLRKMT